MAKNTYIPRDEVVDMNKEINKVRKQAVEELMKIPGVIAVGVGMKEVKGELKRQICFKVTVEKKKPDSEIKPKDRIPDTIYGFITDVSEVKYGEATDNTSNYRPLIGGSQVGISSDARLGTMGCFAKRNSDNKILLLSNWHVIVGNPDNIDGDRVGQPTHNGCCSCCACNEIGKVVDGRFKTDDMDAAIALLSGQDGDTIPEERYLNEIIELGYVAGSSPPLALETIFKYGRTTGLTSGQIISDKAVAPVHYKSYKGITVSRSNQLEITVHAPHPLFVDGGDSGSVSLNEKNQVVGLNYAKISPGGGGYATSIVPILAKLGITILDSSLHSAIAGKEGIFLSTPAITPSNSMAHAMAELETELNQFSEGRRMLEMFKVHRTELLDLVNHKREVMAAWNRYQGPAYLAHIARSIRREDKPVPEQINGIKLQSLLLKMTAVLQRNGSPELVHAVSDNYLKIMHVLSAGKNPSDWKAYLSQINQPEYA